MAEEAKPTVKVEIELPEEAARKLVRPALGLAKEEKPKSVVKQATGYEVGEIISAPLTKHEPDNPRPVYGQIRNVFLGFALVGMSIICWPVFGFSVALAVVVVGATFIAIGTLVRI